MTELLSHSQRSGWLRCPNQFRLRRAGYPAAPSVALIAGTAFHSSCDEVDNNFDAYRELNDPYDYHETAEEIWQSHFNYGVAEASTREPDTEKWAVSGRRTKEKPNKEDLEWWYAAGSKMLEGYVAWRRQEMGRGLDIWTMPDGKLAIEIKFEFDIAPGITVRGAIDRIMVQNGTLLIRDLKTSQRKPDDTSQLGIYRVAVQRMFGQDAVWGDYYLARPGEASAPDSLAHYTEDMLRNEYGFIAKAKQLQLYPANPGSSCISCDVRKACAAVGGVEAPQWLSAMP